MSRKIRLTRRVILIFAGIVLAFALVPFVVTMAQTIMPASTHGTISYSISGSGMVERGDTFDVTVRIDGNTGFAAMPLQFYIPRGLELININLGHSALADGFEIPAGWDNQNSGVTIGSDYARMGWFFRTSNFTIVNTNLLTLTFRVTQTALAGATDNIAVSFATIHGSSAPANIAGANLDITLANNGIIGYVTITEPAGADGIITFSQIPNRPFSQGESFDVTIGIAGNTGFAAMPLQFYVPLGLELTNITLGNYAGLADGFEIPANWTDQNSGTTIGPDFARMGWFFRTSNFTVVNTNLLTLTFRVTQTAPIGATGNITVSFATIHGSSAPANIAGTDLDIALSNNGIIGNVTVGSDLPWISVAPPSAPLINAPGNSISLTVNVGNLTPNETFIIATAPVSGNGIVVSGDIPNWIDVTGTPITINAAGNGSGTITLTINTTLAPIGINHEEQLQLLAEQLFR